MFCAMAMCRACFNRRYRQGVLGITKEPQCGSFSLTTRSCPVSVLVFTWQRFLSAFSNLVYPTLRKRSNMASTHMAQIDKIFYPDADSLRSLCSVHQLKPSSEDRISMDRKPLADKHQHLFTKACRHDVISHPDTQIK